MNRNTGLDLPCLVAVNSIIDTTDPLNVLLELSCLNVMALCRLVGLDLLVGRTIPSTEPKSFNKAT
jgi:hypothetical protein